ncbi:hypothetical protein P5V15_000127 [Pogonomyrmex californicus]
MRFVFVVFGLVFSGFVSGIEYYSDAFDKIDVDAIINSSRLLNQYIDCLFDKGPCTVDGRSLKLILPDALATQCERCTEKQKYMARKISNYLREHKPDTWTAFLEKFDPDKMYIASFKQFLDQTEP